MIRHQLARILSAIADRIEPNTRTYASVVPLGKELIEADKPRVEIQYVYVYSLPPIVTVPSVPISPTPWISSPNTCAN